MFQSFQLIPTMTALENVAAPLELAGARDALKRARDELAAVGLAERLSHYPAQLSGGEQQRVALARALAPRPSLLIADEPTGNLDEATGRTIFELLFKLPRERGATLALVTHDAGLAARCDRVVRIALRHNRHREPRGLSAFRSVPLCCVLRFATCAAASRACAFSWPASRSASRRSSRSIRWPVRWKMGLPAMAAPCSAATPRFR